MKVFGNILKDDFKTILTSPGRRDYLRRQVMRNGNAECLECNHADKCVMEFFKPNKINDDCFGAKKYVEWLINYTDKNDINMHNNKLY